MQPISYSWLASTSTSPLIVVLCIWTIFIFHTYRRRWRTVDLFFLACVVQELISAFFSFGFSILNLVTWTIEAPCGFVLWGLTFTRTFQIATLTSLVVDRALTIRWPYRYRFSVRRNQIRYHIAVLAVVSLFVGVAAVFARLSPPETGSGPPIVPLDAAVSSSGCSYHPHGWDTKFSVFSICLYGALMMVALLCWVDVEIRRCKESSLFVSPQPYQDRSKTGLPSPMSHTNTNSSGSMSSTGSGSTKLLYGGTRQLSRRPYAPDSSCLDFRWTPVAAVSVTCFAVNHLPFLIMTIIGTTMPSAWSSWYENILLWLRLIEGSLIPILLYLTDQLHRNALKRIFDRSESKLDVEGDDSKFRPYPDEIPPYNKKPGAFGSMTPVGIITNYRRSQGRKSANRSWIKAWNNYSTPNVYGVDAILPRKYVGNNLQTLHSHEHPNSLYRMPSVETDLPQYESGLWPEDKHIYATLSDNLSNFSFQSTLADESALANIGNVDDDAYGGSFTTVANDDFEFHDTRPCGGEVRMRPSAEVQQQPTKQSAQPHINSSASQKVKPTLSIKEEYLEMLRKQDIAVDEMYSDDEDYVDSVASSSTDSVRDVVLRIEDAKMSNAKFQDGGFSVYRVSAEELRRSTLGKRRAASFSMNDLDLIETTTKSSEESVSSISEEEPEPEEEETIYVFPVKSESMVSLYKMSVEKPKKAQSETDLTWRGEKNTRNRKEDRQSLWNQSTSSDLCVRKAKRHMKSRKYKVCKKKQRKQNRTVSLNSINRIGSDCKRRGDLSLFGQVYTIDEKPEHNQDHQELPIRMKPRYIFHDRHDFYPAARPDMDFSNKKCVISGFI